VPTAS
jgi:antitoxin HicB